METESARHTPGHLGTQKTRGRVTALVPLTHRPHTEASPAVVPPVPHLPPPGQLQGPGAGTAVQAGPVAPEEELGEPTLAGSSGASSWAQLETGTQGQAGRAHGGLPKGVAPLAPPAACLALG